jgi:hypothetical protein
MSMRDLPLKMLAIGIVVAVLAGCASSSPQWPGGLQVEEHALAAAPEPVPLVFEPLDGTQEEILAKHAGDRAGQYLTEVETLDGNPAMRSLGESDDLIAQVVTSTENPLRQIVKVYRGEEEILAVDGGLPSPALPLQGLWAYGGHWALEVLYSDANTWAGQVYIDGESINTPKGYDEAFGFQLLDGKPFYFYVRGGTVGISYDGEEADLGYAEVIHYRCCAESTLNPLQAVNMVAFFASRAGTWYYVEIGPFGS